MDEVATLAAQGIHCRFQFDALGQCAAERDQILRVVRFENYDPTCS
ncbi:hypothetical protein [Novosphingobium taihuense]|uniref:Uncharacterized protein n=1 Tax=Novosphingobium taihuense TaxID=260085 RepID=A0A7W7ET51_9SPHN|nr:hypothetical protein [Novosphingobium taihuense]MBB4613038.1 hypothetical protein [Novosphingobium taihuense]